MAQIKIMDEEIQKILVFEYFFLKKDIDTLARIFEISALDLKYFFYSVEARSLFKKYESEFNETIVPDSLEQLRNFLVDTFKELLLKAEGKDAAELIDKTIPKIINLYTGQNTPITNNVQMIGNQQVNILEDKRAFVPIQIDYIKPKLLTEEELAQIPPAVIQEIEETQYES